MRKNLATALSLFLLIASGLPAQAMSSANYDHFFACVSWCDVHNKSNSTYNRCTRQCMAYWSRHSG